MFEVFVIKIHLHGPGKVISEVVTTILQLKRLETPDLAPSQEARTSHQGHVLAAQGLNFCSQIFLLGSHSICKKF